jgi:hypothetical membrane protein
MPEKTAGDRDLPADAPAVPSQDAPAAFPASTDTRVLLAACCWVLSLGFFAVEAVVRSAWTTPYSAVENYISDLGAVHCGTVTINEYQEYVCSPLHGVMNAAYIAVGALAVVGAFAGRAAWPAGRLTTTGLVLVAVAGTGAIVAGVFPEDVNQDLHILGALLAVPMSNLGMGLLAVALRRRNRALAACTGLTVLVGLTGLVLTGVPDSGVGIGLAERLAGYPFEVWKAGVGVLLLTACLRGRRRPGNRAAGAGDARPGGEPTRSSAAAV